MYIYYICILYMYLHIYIYIYRSHLSTVDGSWTRRARASRSRVFFRHSGVFVCVVCVCVHVCIYIYAYIYIFVQIYLYTYIYVYIYMYIYMYMYICIYMYVYVYKYVYIYIYIQICTYLHILCKRSEGFTILSILQIPTLISVECYFEKVVTASKFLDNVYDIISYIRIIHSF